MPRHQIVSIHATMIIAYHARRRLNSLTIRIALRVGHGNKRLCFPHTPKSSARKKVTNCGMSIMNSSCQKKPAALSCNVAPESLVPRMSSMVLLRRDTRLIKLSLLNTVHVTTMENRSTLTRTLIAIKQRVLHCVERVSTRVSDTRATSGIGKSCALFFKFVTWLALQGRNMELSVKQHSLFTSHLPGIRERPQNTNNF